MSRRSVLAALAAAAIAFSLSACWVSPGYVQERRDHLNVVLDEFDAASLGDVLCDFEGGEVGVNSGLSHTYLIAGEDAFDLATSRFEDLGFEGYVYENNANYSRPDDIYGELWTHSDDTDLYEDVLAAYGCAEGLEGNLYLHIVESGLGTANS